MRSLGKGIGRCDLTKQREHIGLSEQREHIGHTKQRDRIVWGLRLPERDQFMA